MTQPVSRLRALLVAVPLMVIAIFGSNLLGLWSTPAQEAARVARHEATLRAQEEATRAADSAVSQHPNADGLSNIPNSEEPSGAPSWFKDLMGQLERIAEPLEPPVQRSPTEPPAFDAPVPLPDRQTPAVAFDPAIVVALLSSANVADGARTFRQCRACHTSERGGAAGVGPGLWGIVGRRKAADPNFRYSRSLNAIGGAWTERELALYLHNPRTYAPGTSMMFRGIDNPQRLANVIAYLSTLSDTPPPRPD